MKPQKIVILRHGESDANLSKAVYEHTPDHLVNLTKAGEAQCIALGQRLKPHLDAKKLTIWSSPFKRSRQTSRIVAEQLSKSNVTFKEDPRIREQEWGNFFTEETFYGERDKRRAHSNFFYRIKDGESGADVYDRLSSFLETLYRDFERYPKQDAVLISTHGMTGLVFLMRFFHWTYEQHAEAETFGNCGYVILNLDASSKRYLITDDFRCGLE